MGKSIFDNMTLPLFKLRTDDKRKNHSVFSMFWDNWLDIHIDIKKDVSGR